MRAARRGRALRLNKDYRWILRRQSGGWENSKCE
jgi:hypothetical protein